MKFGKLSWLGILGLIFLSVASKSRAADLSDYYMVKGRHYFQFSDARVEIQTNNAYRFTVILDNVAPGSIHSVRVSTPNGGGINAFPDADGSPWRVRERFDLPFDLENNYPNGVFTINFTGVTDGPRSLGFNITGDQYPNPPVLNDFQAAQGLVTTMYSRITWQPFQGGTASDFIQVQIEDVNNNDAYTTPEYGDEGALTGLDTSFIIPPGFLRAGQQYFATIRFVKVLYSGHRGYPGVPGHAGYFARTEFPVRGASGPARGIIDTLQIWKTRRMEYSTSGILVEDNNPWHFAVRGRARSENMVASGTLTMPSPAGTRAFEVDPSGRDFEYVFGQSTSLSAMDTAFPNGRYTVSVTRPTQATETREFDFPAGTFPPPPSIQNLASFADHPADAPLIVTWNPWVGANEQDFIRVEVEDEFGTEVFDTANYNRDDYLRAGATGVVIPVEVPALLVPGRNYELTVTFCKVNVLDLATAPGGMIFGGHATRTKLNFRTRQPDLLRAGVRLGKRVWERSLTSFQADSARPFEFSASTVASAPDRVSSVAMTTPVGESPSFTTVGVSNVFSAIEPSLAALTARFPAGNYNFAAQSARDGSRQIAVNLPAIELPPQPVIRNISALQATQRGIANTIAWEPWTNADTNTDYVVVTIENAFGTPIGASSAPAGSLNAIPGTASFFTILANVLSANSSYTVRVRFERLLRGFSTEYPGVEERVALFSETAFYMSTITLGNFRLSNASHANGAIQFNVTAPVGPRTYRIDWTPDFREWFPGGTYTSSTVTNFPIELDVPGRFFRLILVP